MFEIGVFKGAPVHVGRDSIYSYEAGCNNTKSLNFSRNYTKAMVNFSF